MKDFSKYQYRKLLEFLEEGYKFDTDRTNYATLLLSMEKAESIKELLDIYEDVFCKLPHYIYMKGYVPEYWHIPDYWAGYKKYLAIELNLCLNENLLRLFKTKVNPTKEQRIKFIINLRNCGNQEDIENELISGTISDDKKDIQEIINKRNKSYSLRESMMELNPDTNGFIDAEQEYIEIMKVLLSFGYIKGPTEERFEELSSIFYEEEGKYNLNVQNKPESYLGGFIVLIVIIFVILACFYFLSKIGFFGFIVIVAFICLLPKFLLTGKL